MSVTRGVDLLVVAQHFGNAYGAFNVIQLEHAEAIIAGAEDIELPVIIQISENTVRYHGGLAAIGTATLIMARDSERMRGSRPFLFADLRSEKGKDELLAWIRREVLFDRVPQ